MASCARSASLDRVERLNQPTLGRLAKDDPPSSAHRSSGGSRRSPPRRSPPCATQRSQRPPRAHRSRIDSRRAETSGHRRERTTRRLYTEAGANAPCDVVRDGRSVGASTTILGVRFRDARLGVVLAGLVVVPAALAAGASGGSAAANQAAAYAAAARLLPLVQLPAGATSSSTNPVAGQPLNQPTLDEATPNLVDAHAGGRPRPCRMRSCITSLNVCPRAPRSTPGGSTAS